MVYKEKFKIGLKDVWKKDEVSNIAILEYLENVAAYHSDSVGYGVSTTAKTNLNWLLLDWRVKVIKRPKYGQILEIHTWSKKIEKFYAYRDFEVYDNENNLCVIATSKWLLVNSKTEKISRVDPQMAKKYESEPEKEVFSTKDLEKLKVPEKYEKEMKYKVQRKDIDVIGHMHNLYYLNLAYEALPEEIYNIRPFSDLRIMYKKEIKLGETVKCKYTCENQKHIVVIESEDSKTLHSIIELWGRSKHTLNVEK